MMKKTLEFPNKKLSKDVKDYRYKICQKFQENPVLAKVEFKYEGKEWKIELNRYESGFFAFIIVNDSLKGQVKLDYTQDEFFDDLKSKEGVEDLKIEILNLF